jgi:hypothetical protein
MVSLHPLQKKQEAFSTTTLFSIEKKIIPLNLIISKSQTI